MRLDAMKRQAGRPLKENGAPVGHHLSGQKSRDILAEETGESREQVRRYIRLTNLEENLLDMVDDGKIALRPAVELSYLTEKEQNNLFETISFADATPSLAQAIKMRSFSKEGKLSKEVIESIISEEKPNQKEKISFRTIESFKYLIIILLCIFFLPLVILFYIIYGIKNKGIFNVNKILNFLLKYKNE